MLYDKKNIPELNKFYHRNDDVNKNYVKYEDKILKRTLSPYLYSNKMMASFLEKIEPMIALFFDQFTIIKNWKNFTVDKYYDKGTD